MASASSPRSRTLSRLPKLATEYVTVPRLAEMLGRSKESLYQACRRGEVPGAFQIGRIWRINLAAFEAATGSSERRQEAA